MNAMLPVWHEVVDREPETADTVTLRLRPVGDAIAAPAPGQFTMLYVFGVGEVPISVSGSGPGRLDQTLRAVGAVTRALCDCRPGDVIGVRGPFGAGWRLPRSPDRDLLLVAGGIGLAPLRPALVAALVHRAHYRTVTLVVGTRTPGELLFAGAMADWAAAGARIETTVDHPTDGWSGRVGVAPAVLDDLHLEPVNTTALVCGPEVMMRFTAAALLRRGVAASDIQVSLERNMRCGVAWCGHCQLGPLLLCRDGPVVTYDLAAPLLAVKEL